MRPTVGPPTMGTGCAHGADLDSPACGAAPAQHVRVLSAWGDVALTTCADHAQVARECGTIVQEHRYGAACTAGECWSGS